MSNNKLDLVRDAYRAEHADSVMTWQDLERKAQATVAIAGVFLAAVVAFVRDSGSLVQLQQIVLTATTLLLVTSVFTAAISMRVKEYPGPPSGADIKKLAEENTDADEAFHAALAAKWECQIDQLCNVNASKVTWLRVSQLALYVAVILAAWAAGLRIWLR